MGKTCLHWYCYLGKAIGLAIAFGTALHAIALSGKGATAQMLPDNTLPNNSVVTNQGNVNVITGGTKAGSNLFHSFEQFSVPSRETAFFNNSLSIQNIITRITGKSVSNIDGIIQANGTANVFLLNPNGIIFGNNASLNIGGSFVATTASSLKFADGTEFSALHPQSQPLLTISVPLGLQFEGATKSIINQSKVTDSSGKIVGLQVQPGKTLALIGGDITLADGHLTAEGGKIELGSVAGFGLVSLNTGINAWTFNYDAIQNFGNIQLSKQSRVNASGAEGGNIEIQGRQVTLTEGSKIVAETSGNQNGGEIFIRANHFTVTNLATVSTNTSGAGKAGNINVQAKSVEISGASDDGLVFSALAATSKGTGDSGNIAIQTEQLIIKDGAQVSTASSGAGKAGNINVQAQLVKVSGGAKNGHLAVNGNNGQSTLAATSSGTGNSGNITIKTARLIAEDGGDISVSALGTNVGKGGNLVIDASESIELSGVRVWSENLFSRSGGFAATEGTQPGGDLVITTSRLVVKDGARISVSTRGAGDENRLGGQGGNLTVKADVIELIGTSVDGKFPSGIFALSGEERPNFLDPKKATGNAGNVTLEAGRLTVKDGAQVSAASLGGGKGGNITLQANLVEVIGGASNGRTSPTGNNGQSTLAATSSGTGDSGNIKIVTKKLVAQEGGDISVTAFGAGRSGNITISASSIELIGFRIFPNGIFSRTGVFGATEGTQPGGDVTITTGSLLVKDGARISVSTRGAGDKENPGGQGGNLIVKATELVELTGISADGRFRSGLYALSGEQRPNITANEATGNGGDLRIEAGQLIVRNGAEVSVNAQGLGRAGNIQVNADSIWLENGSITGVTREGQGGNIILQAEDLIFLRSNSNISTTAGSDQFGGDGGNITIKAPFLIAIPSENSDISANAFSGNGGKVDIVATGIIGTQFREQPTSQSDITATSIGGGRNGVVNINVFASDSTVESVPLPKIEVNTDIVVVCQPGGKSGEFINTGNGGKPIDPRDSLTIAAGWEDKSLPTGVETAIPAKIPTTATPKRIIQAQGWVMDANGTVFLTAEPPTVTPESSLSKPTSCKSN